MAIGRTLKFSEWICSRFESCQLYETSSQLPITVQNEHLFLVHVNIRSVNKNLYKLNHELLQSFQFLPDVICLSEAKIKNNPLINVTLNGYQPILHADSPSNAGDVGVFVADKYSVNNLEKNELKCTCEDLWNLKTGQLRSPLFWMCLSSPKRRR